MKKVIIGLMFLCFMTFSNDFKNFDKIFLENINDKNIEKIINNKLPYIEKISNYVIKTIDSLVPKLVGTVIYVGEDNVDFDIKYKKFIITYYANEDAKFYIYETKENFDKIINDLKSRNLNINNVYFIDKNSIKEIDFIFNILNDLVEKSIKNPSDKIKERRIAIITDVHKTKGYLFSMKDYVDTKNSNLIIDEYSYYNTKLRSDVDKLNKENIEILKNIIIEYIKKYN